MAGLENQTATPSSEAKRRTGVALVAASLSGVAALAAAALWLWSSEGGELFLQSAFAAVAGCL